MPEAIAEQTAVQPHTSLRALLLRHITVVERHVPKQLSRRRWIDQLESHGAIAAAAVQSLPRLVGIGAERGFSLAEFVRRQVTLWSRIDHAITNDEMQDGYNRSAASPRAMIPAEEDLRRLLDPEYTVEDSARFVLRLFGLRVVFTAYVSVIDKHEDRQFAGCLIEAVDGVRRRLMPAWDQAEELRVAAMLRSWGSGPKFAAPLAAREVAMMCSLHELMLRQIKELVE